jgi:hypothetical protein
MDPLLLVIGALLLMSLTAFLCGLIPYPFGWIVLSILFVLRLRYLSRRNPGGNDGFRA